MKGRTKQVVITLACLSLAAALLLGGCGKSDTEETAKGERLYTNAKVYTVDKDFSTASNIVTKGDRILYVGDDAEKAKSFTDSKTETVDLQGKTVIPGFIDSHLHYIRLGERLKNVDIYLKSKEDILKAVKAEVDKVKPGDWIGGAGWNNEVWKDKKWPTKADLDKIAPKNPVMLTRSDNHAMWVNSKALKAAKITKKTPDPKGGAIEKDKKGEVTGILKDTAMTIVKDAKPPMSEKRNIEGMKLAQEQLFSYGITSAGDCGINLTDLDLTKRLYENGTLKVRLSEFITAADNSDKTYIESGKKPERGLYNNRLDIAGVKVVNDGSLGSRSAAMLKEYSDEPGTLGLPRFTQRQLDAIVKRDHEAGFQIAMHAIGDAAVNQGLNAYEKIEGDNKDNQGRHRIEHFQVAIDADIDRAIKLKIIPSMNACHATSDMNMAQDRIGAERLKTAYAWRTIIDKGGEIANGTDAPVEPVDPFNNFSAAVTRKNADGEPVGGFQPQQKITREEALRSATSWAAYAQFGDELKGSIEKGKLADFAVLDADIMSCPEDSIKNIKVLRTILGGEEVYNTTK